MIKSIDFFQNRDIGSICSDEFGSVRIFRDEDKFLFCGNDVASVLGYAKPANAVSKYCKGVTVLMTPSPGGIQKTKFISEGDVYRLITHSKQPSAEKFEHWVFDEVLPTIRRHGIYANDEVLERMENDPHLVAALRATLAQEREQNRGLQNTVQQLTPKADYYDAFINPYEFTNLRITAKELGVPEKRFVKYLQLKRYLYRSPSGQLLPYAKHEGSGLFYVKDYCRHGHMDAYTLFTPKGKDHFRHRIAEILETPARKTKSKNK